MSLSDTPTRTFDFVIIGGGAAGCVLADRLSEDGRHEVALLEAGEWCRSLWGYIPVGFYKLLTNPRYNWMFTTAPEPGTCNRAIATPRGKGIGGSTLINGMIYVRGQRLDYDGWAAKGCPGWSFDDMLPVFKRIEDFAGPADAFRAKGGKLPIEEVRERPELAEAFLRAAESYGLARNPDYNGAYQEGCGYYQVNQRNGLRVSAATAYLRPALGRKNLTVLTGAFAKSLILDGRRVRAVIADIRGTETRISARRGVVLAAGAVQTPQLLELSGIGNPEILRAAGIEPVHALLGVGENYSDHFCTRMNWRVTRPVTLNEYTRGVRLFAAVLQFGLTRRGILTLGSGLAHAFAKTRASLETADMQYFFMHASYGDASTRQLERQPGMTLGVSQMRPLSRGSIHAANARHDRQAIIKPAFLTHEEDCRAMVEGMKIGRRIVEAGPLESFVSHEISPGKDVQSDDEWIDFARRTGQSIYHVAGTCKMGVDPMAVVSPQLKVHGLEHAWIADASIMPDMVSGNIQATVLAIAYKAADYILAEAKSGAASSG